MADIANYIKAVLEDAYSNPDAFFGPINQSSERIRYIATVVAKEAVFLQWLASVWNSIADDLEKLEFQEQQNGFVRKPISPRVRFSVFKRDKYRCQICGASAGDDGAKLHLDHRIPVAKGGTNDTENLWCLCSACNLGKHTELL